MTVNPVDPIGPAAGVRRVLRGGSWSSAPAKRLAAANRANYSPDDRRDPIGFRLTVTLPCNESTPVVQ